MIRQGPKALNPFYYDRGGSSLKHNGFGAIAFDAIYDKGEIIAAAQLFLNREIWAFNTITLSPDIATSKHGSLFLYSFSVEQTFAVMFREYLQVMNGNLGVPPPYRIEGGASGIKDYVIQMPSSFYGREWGPVLQDHVSWSGVLQSMEAGDVDAALLNIFEAFFDAAGRVRPKPLHHFPGETAGADPH